MLYIVGTPIGNLKDISQRAKETLAGADIIIIESPADSKRLLNVLGISGKAIRKFNDENAKKVLPGLIEEIQGKNAAYITSAGMPAISDPGALLVQAAREKGIGIQVVPGPSAVMSALAGSGIRTNEFVFIGFLPRKTGQIEKIFRKHTEMESVLIFFESPFRILKSIASLAKVSPEARVCAAKELTKMFENYFIGTPDAIFEELSKNPKNTKGEFTVVVDFRNSSFSKGGGKSRRI